MTAKLCLTLFAVDVAAPRGCAAEKARVGLGKSRFRSENATQLKPQLDGSEKYRIGRRKMEGEQPEVAEVLRQYLPGNLEKHKVSVHQRQVLEAIKNCRTHRMGYYLSVCDECGHQEWMYNSCRDRHCPKCQWVDQQAWVEDRMHELPKVPYHHVVATMPDQMHNLMLLNKAAIYQLAFEAVAETLQTFGRDPKHLGAEIGCIIAVLHTWGQTLNYHVHIHCLVTAGGLTKNGEWVEGKYKDKFLFPVRALSQVFRGKFIAKLRKVYKDKKLKMEGKIAWMENPAKFEAFIGQLARQMFRIHSKPARLTCASKRVSNRAIIGKTD